MRQFDHGKQRYRFRSFLAWDGEGWTDDAGKHHYSLFGCSNGRYVDSPSLSTEACLDLISSVGEENLDSIHVGFSFGYDVNMILRDLSWKQLRQLKATTQCEWEGWTIEHIPGKWFAVKAPGGWWTKIHDIFSFFGTSFVKALQSWGVGTKEAIGRIESGKEARGDFSLCDMEGSVYDYWSEELSLLVELAQTLRSTLALADIHPSSWHGPGAIATQLYKRYKIKGHLNRELDPAVLEASTYAYAGGRFETFRAGYYDGPVYSADINSAYPYALSTLPSMADDNWYYTEDVDEILSVPTRVGLYHVSWAVRGDLFRGATFKAWPMPAFLRDRYGNISFPTDAEGWYHAEEFRRLVYLHDQYPECFDVWDVSGAWIYWDNNENPFAWVGDLYRQRQEWKREGNAGERAIKLGLNSLYGKLAQRVGGKVGEGAPPWHQLEWAGAITAFTRGMLWDVGWQVRDGLIAMETDGIYSTVPFPDSIDAGKGLGQWEMSTYTGILFLQNGVYFLRDSDGNWLPPKSRGVPQKSFQMDRVMDALRSGSSVTSTQAQFVGYGTALVRRDSSVWRTWQDTTKEFRFGGAGKRNHVPFLCRSCGLKEPIHESLHYMSVKPVREFLSYPHPLPWNGMHYSKAMQRARDEARWMTHHD